MENKRIVLLLQDVINLIREKQVISKIRVVIRKLYDKFFGYLFLFFSRGLSILFIYLFNYLLIQKASLEESGIFLSIISYGSLLINILNLGQTTLITKKVSNYFYFNHNKYIFKLFISTWRVLTVNFFIAIFLYGVCEIFFVYFLNNLQIGLPSKVILIIVTSYINSILILIGEFVKSIKEYERSIFFSLTLPNLVAVFLLMFRSNVSFYLLYEFYIFSLILSITISTIYLIKKIGIHLIKFISLNTIYKKSIPFFGALLLSQAIYVLDTFFIDIYLPTSNVAIFFIVKKIALFVFLPAQIMSTIFSQKISTLSFLENTTNTKIYFKQIVFNLLIISLCPLFIVSIFGEYILSFWGIEFVKKGTNGLLLLSMGYFLIGVSYPYYYFLLFSEKAKKNNFIFLCFTNILFILLCFLVCSLYHVSIAAIAGIELLLQIVMSSFYILYVHIKLKYSS